MADQRELQIAIMGNKKSGKTSIARVVFQKMSVNETWFIESTNRVEVIPIQNNPYTKFSLLDFPGTFDPLHMNSQEKKYLESCAMIIYVLDAQDEPYNAALQKLVTIMTKVNEINAECKYEVFIHKIDGDMFTNDELKLEVQNEVSDILKPEINERGLPEPAYHLTSIYDLTVYEALSKVIHKITPQVAYLQNLLDVLMTNCRMDKVYVFDVISKLYIATDSTPVDLISYELCSDMIDVVIDVSCIYGMGKEENYNKAFDNKSTSVIKLDTGLTLYLREVEHLLALVCLVKDENFDRQHLIDYNIDCFREGAQKIFEAHKKLSREQEESKV